MTVASIPHYTVKQIEGMDDLRAYFPDDQGDAMNWLVLSTSGVHGSYTTLDDLEREWDDPERGGHWLTVLVIQPRLCALRYGEIEVEREDIPWLRGVVGSSLAAMTESQQENV